MNSATPPPINRWLPEPPHGKTYSPVIISVALTGAVPQKSRYPSLPTTPTEIADQSLRCAEAGASLVHLHMRDAAGNQTQSKELLEQTISLIRDENEELIVCATTTSRSSQSVADRATPFGLAQPLMPDLASLTMGSYNTPTGPNVNPFEEIIELGKLMADTGVRPEIEIFDRGMLYELSRLIERRQIPRPALINILLGVNGSTPASALELALLAELLPPGVEWGVAGIGKFQKNMTILGCLMGANVRVGMEDDPRGEADNWDNIASVKRAVEAAEFVGRHVESIQGARQRLGLTENRQQTLV